MTPSQLFWALTFVWTTVLIALAFRGFVQIRRGDVAAHRRSMDRAILMVGIFVLAYVVKVIVLGKEGIQLWAPRERTILYVHETMVAIMLLAGGRARWLARRVGKGGAEARFHTRKHGKGHRLAGRVALVAGALALFTAGLVLLGMLARGG